MEERHRPEPQTVEILDEKRNNIRIRQIKLENSYSKHI